MAPLLLRRNKKRKESSKYFIILLLNRERYQFMFRFSGRDHKIFLSVFGILTEELFREMLNVELYALTNKRFLT